MNRQTVTKDDLKGAFDSNGMAVSLRLGAHSSQNLIILPKNEKSHMSTRPSTRSTWPELGTKPV